MLDAVVDAVAGRWHDELAPAVERVWNDEIASIRRDLHAWLDYLARDGDEWLPKYFEFGFGTVPGERDARSVRDEVTLPGGFRLRGAIDLIEEHRADEGAARHRSQDRPQARRIEKVIIGGGAVLQPVLYAMAVEAALGQPVSLRPAVLLHVRRQLPCARDPAERHDAGGGPRGAAGRSTAPSSAASSPRRRRRRPAAAATSGRSAAPTSSAACSASRRTRSPISRR